MKLLLKHWSARIVFVGSTIIIPLLYDSQSTDIKWKLSITGILLILYVISEVVKENAISDEQIIVSMLARVETLKYINPVQNLRANLFKSKPNGDHKLIFSYNMEKAPDRDLVIDKNLGVTGHVFMDGCQLIAGRALLYNDAKYELPDRIMKKIPTDLQWICATPLKDKKDKVIWVLNFDGNQDSQAHFTEIKEHANKLAVDLKLPLGLS